MGKYKQKNQLFGVTWGKPYRRRGGIDFSHGSSTRFLSANSIRWHTVIFDLPKTKLS